jgi:hypothetical protein
MGFIGFFIEKPKTHSAEFENVGFSHPWHSQVTMYYRYYGRQICNRVHLELVALQYFQHHGATFLTYCN